MYWVADVGARSPSHLEKIWIATFSEQCLLPKLCKSTRSACWVLRARWCPYVALRPIEACFPGSWLVSLLMEQQSKRLYRYQAQSLCVSHSIINLCESDYSKGQRRMHQLVSKQEQAKPIRRGQGWRLGTIW